ncbi:MAG: hypothetical protein KF860_08950 [Cyclobacteriaceae bacterium]|nr:hypothetical protein [Cyclobacteriaceae bacterium]
MSIVSENIIPGGYGRIFGTDATTKTELNRIAEALRRVNGVKDVIVDYEIFPHEFTIHSNTVVKIEEIQNAAIQQGFHVIPKSLFKLL